MMLVCFVVMGGINVVLVVLVALLLLRENRVERENHEASLQALTTAMDHLIGRNNVLMGEITRRRYMRRSISESGDSTRSL